MVLSFTKILSKLFNIVINLLLNNFSLFLRKEKHISKYINIQYSFIATNLFKTIIRF